MIHLNLAKREDIDEKYKWDLSKIYKTLEDWEDEYNQVNSMLPEFEKYKGNLGKSSDILFECLKKRDAILEKAEKLFVYAKMKRDENNANAQYQSLTDRANFVNTKVSTEIAFIVPEIVNIDEDVLNGYINKDSRLDEYKQFFKELLREKEHTLSPKIERVLALSYDVCNVPEEIFCMYNNADIKFPFIKDENGNEVELTKGRYTNFLESENRQVRKDAFMALYNTYGKNINTIANMLVGYVKAEKFLATVRKYKSTIHSALEGDNIPLLVYDKLITTINNNLNLMYKYLKIRKDTLKVDKLHMYDLYVPLVKNDKEYIKFEQAKEIVLEALKPLGKEYIDDLTKGLNSGWVDVFENEGKTGGAYSWGTYSTSPYVLLNYQGTINDVFTLAHELGHSMHSFYTNKNQPYIKSHYRIFVAEVASTVNELLLMKHLLKVTTDKDKRAYILNHYLESFRGTVFRQVMFAEFEKIIHEKIWNDEPLTAESLNEIYLGLNKTYFGEDVSVDDEIKMEWARIPHFYSSFYVYKYATGFCSACALSRQILEDGEEGVNKYLEFLASGCSDYPVELLKKAGVDLSTSKPIEDALETFNNLLDEFREIIK